MSYAGKAVTILSSNPKFVSDGRYIVLHDDGVLMSVIGSDIGWNGQYQSKIRHEYVSYIKEVKDFDMSKFIARQRDWADAPKRGGKLQYVESVYTNANVVLDLLEDVLGKTTQETAGVQELRRAVFPDQIMTVVFEDGNLVWVKDSGGNSTLTTKDQLTFI